MKMKRFASVCLALIMLFSLTTVYAETVSAVKAGLLSANYDYGKKVVSLTTSTEGATIYYKTALNSEPANVTTSNGTKYTGPITLSGAGKHYIKAIAVKSGYTNSTQFSGTVTVESLAAPVISVSSANSSGRKTVTVTAAEGSEIYYTTDGTTPTPSSLSYPGPVSVGSNVTFKAVAARKGYATSTAATKSVTASGGSVSVSKPGAKDLGNSPNGARNIQLTCQSGASIYYAVTDQSVAKYNVTVEDNLYTEPIVFNKTGKYRIWAMACMDGFYSSVVTVNLEANVEEAEEPAAVEKPTHAVNTLSNGIKVVSLSAGAGCKIYYVFSSSALTSFPMSGATEYTYPITINKVTYLYAVAADANGNVSDMLAMQTSDKTFPNGEVTPDSVNAEITLATSQTLGEVSAVISCADETADLFYVADASPSTVATTADTPYVRGSKLTFTNDGYLHVTAAKPGYTSASKTFAITLNRQKTAAPAITTFVDPNTGRYTVHLESTTPNARFYYTVDNSEPTTQSREAANGFVTNVNEGVTFKAVAVAEGYLPSDVVTEVITSVLPPSLVNITVGNVTAKAGEVVSVPVTISGNPGMARFNFSISYDTEKLSHVSTEKGSALTEGAFAGSAATAFWANPDDVSVDGEILKLTFTVAEGTPAGEVIPVSLSYNAGDICNKSNAAINATVVNGGITVAENEPDPATWYSVNSLDVETPSNGNVYAKISVTKAADTESEDTLVIAVYKDGALVDMTTMQALYAKGQTVTFRGRVKWEEGCTLKAFVWDSIEGMKVLSNSLEK